MSPVHTTAVIDNIAARRGLVSVGILAAPRACQRRQKCRDGYFARPVRTGGLAVLYSRCLVRGGCVS